MAFALSDRQALLEIEVPAGTTAGEAIERSGILRQYPSIDLSNSKIGIFGSVVALDRVLDEGDRVEIYRPLVADPKQARRRRATAGKKAGD